MVFALAISYQICTHFDPYYHQVQFVITMEILERLVINFRFTSILIAYLLFLFVFSAWQIIVLMKQNIIFITIQVNMSHQLQKRLLFQQLIILFGFQLQ